MRIAGVARNCCKGSDLRQAVSRTHRLLLLIAPRVLPSSLNPCHTGSARGHSPKAALTLEEEPCSRLLQQSISWGFAEGINRDGGREATGTDVSCERHHLNAFMIRTEHCSCCGFSNTLVPGPAVLTEKGFS